MEMPVQTMRYTVDQYLAMERAAEFLERSARRAAQLIQLGKAL